MNEKPMLFTRKCKQKSRLRALLHFLPSIVIIFFGYIKPFQVYAHGVPPTTNLPLNFSGIVSLPTSHNGMYSGAGYLINNKMPAIFDGSVTLNAGTNQTLTAGATVTNLSGTISGTTTGTVANLIVIFGESNASGEAPNSSCTSAELAVRTNTKIWNDNVNGFQSMQIGVNNQIQQGYNPVDVHGLENGLANGIDAGQLAKPTYLVKLGSPGARIDQWLKGGTPQNDQMGWSVVVARMNAAINNLNAQGIAFKITVWESIGINDYNAGTSNATYQSRIEQFRSDFRNLFGASIPFLQTLFFASHPYDPVIQTIANDDPQGTSAAIYTDDAPRQPDGAHWTHDGYIIIANRMIANMAAAASPVTTTTAWSKVSGPAGGNISSPANLNTGITALQAGTYVFRLSATQNGTVVATSDVTIVVPAVAVNQPPIADAGSDISITLPTNSVTVNGSASSDPDGSISSYLWTKISGPTQSTIVSNISASTNINNLTAGIYLFQLKVTDNAGAISLDTIKVTVNPAPLNQPPVANAGANKSITLPTNSVVIDGSASAAASGNSIVSYTWTEKSGPSTVSLSNTPQNTLNNLQAGIYVFILKVTDNKGGTASDSVSVTVIPYINKPPVANAGSDVTLVLPVNSTTLDGTASYDPDGSISGYAWTRISGPNMPAVTGTNASILKLAGLVAGTYIYQLTVTDNSGVSASAQVKITVNPAPVTPPPVTPPPVTPVPNIPPVANAGPDQTITAPANSVLLNGSASTDPDGNIVSYSWTTVSGPGSATINNSNTVTPAVVGLVPGSYVFELTVTDNKGANSKDEVNITVLPKPITPNQAPVANAGNNLTITAPVSTVSLNGSSSFDPDGTISVYSWTQVSGPSASIITGGNTSTPVISQLTIGQYVFELTVTDNNGAKSSDQVTVTVNGASNKVNIPPVANAGPDDTLLLPNNSYTLNAGKSTDADGSIVSYQWQQISGPNTVKSSNMAVPQVAISDFQAGVYEFQVVVTDNEGATSTAVMKLTVEADAGVRDRLFLFPNPAHDVTTAKITSSVSGTVKIVMYDMNGRLVLTTEAEKTDEVITKALNISTLASGMYTVQVVIGNKKTLITKFIKN